MNDGGPAFPGIEGSHASSDEYQNPYTAIDAYEGMTLRDYFAAKAIPMILAKTFTAPGDINIIACAGACYQIADAMIAARDSETQS